MMTNVRIETMKRVGTMPRSRRAMYVIMLRRYGSSGEKNIALALLFEVELTGIEIARAHVDPVGHGVFGHVAEVVLHHRDARHGADRPQRPQIVGVELHDLLAKIDLLRTVGGRLQLIEQLERLG